MRLLLRLVFVLVLSGDFLGVFAQDTTPRAGFAIVTLLSGNIAGLVATENLTSSASTGIEQAIVAPSTLTTTASILVPVGPVDQNTTAIAITNPSPSSGGVNLVLNDASGNVVLNTTIQLGPRGHFSQFINDLFPTQPAELPTPLLLTVSSEVPVAILAFNFRGGSFTAIPSTTLSSPTPVPIQPLTPPPTTPSSSTSVATAGSIALPGFGLGLPPVPPMLPPVTAPITLTTTPVQTTTSIGGTASLVFAQVVTGGGWSTEIALGNTSAGTQNVRIDFFDDSGTNTGSISNVAIPSRGVFFFATAP